MSPAIYIPVYMAIGFLGWIFVCLGSDIDEAEFICGTFFWAVFWPIGLVMIVVIGLLGAIFTLITGRD